jgi:hypothetical protein
MRSRTRAPRTACHADDPDAPSTPFGGWLMSLLERPGINTPASDLDPGGFVPATFRLRVGP